MHSTGPWSKQDLFFLEDALGSSAEVAAFLGRQVDEIREKARELGRPCEELKSGKT
jgi:hypothetical protein